MKGRGLHPALPLVCTPRVGRARRGLQKSGLLDLRAGRSCRRRVRGRRARAPGPPGPLGLRSDAHMQTTSLGGPGVGPAGTARAGAPVTGKRVRLTSCHGFTRSALRSFFPRLFLPALQRPPTRQHTPGLRASAAEMTRGLSGLLPADPPACLCQGGTRHASAHHPLILQQPLKTQHLLASPDSSLRLSSPSSGTRTSL